MQKSLYSYELSNNEYVEFRLFSNDDSVEELTQLLNKSYKSLADMGFNYVAATQGFDITLDRIKKAYKSYVGIYKNRIISTISIYEPKPLDGNAWYSKDFVAKIGQFAVEPELQRYGIGSRMMDIVEDEARRMKNIRELALDTAETAYHLIDYYKKRGYKYIETIKWDVTNYKSVVLSKKLYYD